MTSAVSDIPAGLRQTRRTPSFTQETVPAALLRDHSTKPGVWGLIRVEQGRLRYRVTDPAREGTDRILTPHDRPGIVEPAILHCVEPLGEVRFHVEFYQ